MNVEMRQETGPRDEELTTAPIPVMAGTVADEPFLPPAVEQWFRENRYTLGICLALFVATFCVFGRTIGHEFLLYDDNEYVYKNRNVVEGLTPAGVYWTFTNIHSANWHPLTSMSHMLDCSVYGLWPGGHHLTNVLLHAAASVAIFMALRRLTGASWRSGIVASLFCVHPLHVESVAWISERKDVLSGLFFGLTLWAYADYARQPFSSWRYLAVLVLFTMGLLCKPMLVTVPFLFLLLDYWPLERFQPKAWNEPSNALNYDAGPASPRMSAWLLLEKVPFMVLSALSSVVTYQVQSKWGAFAEDVSPGICLQTAVLGYFRYLGKMCWPIDLAPMYPRDREVNTAWVAISVVALTLITLAFWHLRHRAKYAIVGWLWYVGMLIPVSGIVALGDQSIADRYSYLTLTGVFVVVVWGACSLLDGWRGEWVLATVVLVLLGLAGISMHQVGYWRNGETLFRHAVAVIPGNSLAHVNLGMALMDQKGRVAEAEEQFRESLRIKPTEFGAHNNLGLLERRKGNLQVAIGHYLAALEAKPDFALARSNLAVAFAEDGQLQDAEDECREAIRLDPDLAAAESNLAMVLTRQGRFSEAIVHHRRAIELDPVDGMERVRLGTSLVAMGSHAEGIEELKEVLRTDPNHVEGHHELAKVYHSLGQLRDAADEWKEVLERQPDHVAAAKGLGVVLVKAGRGGDAVRFLDVALAAEPRDLETRKYKALAHLAARQVRDALKEFREILARDPQNQHALNSIAWIEATHPDATIRNGLEAVDFAKKAVALQKSDAAELLSTLAAAYAEAGQFKDAVETGRRAKKVAEESGNRILAQAITGQMELYEKGSPYREEM